MNTLLTLLIIASGVIASIGVLAQKSSGSGLSDLFGGSGGGTLGASAVGVKNLVRITKVAFIIFAGSAFLLAVISR